MRPKRTDSIVIRLDVLPFPAPPDDMSWVRCVQCDKPLDLQQPDAQAPDRLLGICWTCSSWFLIELATERSEMIMVQLPDGSLLRGEPQR
jgi:hypothetical protein